MAESLHHIKIKKGSSFSLDLSFAEVAGINVNVDSFAVSMELKMTRASTSRVVASLTEKNGKVVVNRTTGQARFTLSGAETNAIGVGTSYYEVRVSLPYQVGGETVTEWFRIFEGKFEIV